MTRREGLFVKINFDNKEVYGKGSRSGEFMRNSAIDSKKYLLCGGVFNRNGGTMIFQANSIDEAQDIVLNNPFVNSQVYTYEISNNKTIML